LAAAPEEPLKATGGEFWQQVRRVCDLHLLSLPVDPAAALSEAALLRYLAAESNPSSGTASPTPPTASTPPRPRPARAAARRYVLRKKHNSFIRIGLRMYFGCLENGLDRIGFSAL